VDVERWWRSYQEYNDYLHGGRTIDKVGVMEPAFIMADLRNYIDLLTTAIQKGYLPPVALILYTGKWYTDGYLVSQGENLFYDAAPSWKNAGVTVCTAAYTAPTSGTWEQIGTYMPTGSVFDAGFGTATLTQFSGGTKLPNGKYPAQGFDLEVAILNNGLMDTLFDPAPAPVATSYKVSGKVTLDGAGLSNVAVTLGLLNTITAIDGIYTFSNVPANTGGMILPILDGYKFDPINYGVINLSSDLLNQNFTATKVVNPPPPNPVPETDVLKAIADLSAKVDKLMWLAK
jgi:hypothetical protein